MTIQPENVPEHVKRQAKEVPITHQQQADKVPTIQQMEGMKDEYHAWTAWCREFAKVAQHNLNNPELDQMVRAIRYWGETLVSLRVEQTPAQRFKAYEEARDDYEGNSSNPSPEK